MIEFRGKEVSTLHIFERPQDAINTIISLIGCITGVSSLIVTLVKWLLEKPKESIEILAPELCGFYEHCNKDLPSQKYVVLYNLTISNVRQTPFTIKKIQLISDNIALSNIHQFKLKNGIILFRESDKPGFAAFDLYNQFEYLYPPRMLKPYELVNFRLVFPGDDLYKSYKNNDFEPIYVVLKIQFSHKEVNHVIKLSEINYDRIIQFEERNKSQLKNYQIVVDHLPDDSNF